MSAQLDYTKNEKYFKKASVKFPVILAFIGLIIFFAGVGVDGGAIAILIGFLAIAGGVLLIYRQFSGRVTDEEYEKQAWAKVHNLRQQALSKLGVDEDDVQHSEPIEVGGFLFREARLFKLGKDRQVRTDMFQGMVTFFGEDQLYYYRYRFSMVEPGKDSHTSDEVFYDDVVSVNIDEDNEQIPTGKPDGSTTTETVRSFQLNLAGGQSISSTVRNIATAEATIKGGRALIREKKRAQRNR